MHYCKHGQYEKPRKTKLLTFRERCISQGWQPLLNLLVKTEEKTRGEYIIAALQSCPPMLLSHLYRSVSGQRSMHVPTGRDTPSLAHKASRSSSSCLSLLSRYLRRASAVIGTSGGFIQGYSKLTESEGSRSIISVGEADNILSLI